jgi:hypothetical protein
MDVKRVAFETKAVSSKVPSSKFQVPSSKTIENPRPKTENQNPKRAEIAAIVDKFLSQKLAETPKDAAKNEPAEQIRNPKSEIRNPVKTIIHELKPASTTNGSKPSAVDFVSETDVRNAIDKGEKIYITPKTIVTPAARDLGDEKEIFAVIK